MNTLHVIVNITKYKLVSSHDDLGDAMIKCRHLIDESRHTGTRDYFEVQSVEFFAKN